MKTKKNDVSLTSCAFLVGEERGSRLHLELRQCLLLLNRFPIVDQIQVFSEVWIQLQDLLLQFPDGIGALRRHRNPYSIRAIKEIHRKDFRMAWKRLLNLERGVGGVSTRLMVGNRNRVFRVSFHILPGSTFSTLKIKVWSLKENRDIHEWGTQGWTKATITTLSCLKILFKCQHIMLNGCILKCIKNILTTNA